MWENPTSLKINEQYFIPFKWYYFLLGPCRGNWVRCLSLFRRCPCPLSAPITVVGCRSQENFRSATKHPRNFTVCQLEHTYSNAENHTINISAHSIKSHSPWYNLIYCNFLYIKPWSSTIRLSPLYCITVYSHSIMATF